MTTDGTGDGSAPGGRDPDALVARAGKRADTRKDQHFLIDDRVLDRIPGYAEAMDRSHVLEVGAGPGALTDRLLAVSDRVTAVERDPDFAAHLREEFADAIDADRLTVVEGDALKVDLPAFTASVSNLPYGASSEIAFRLLPLKRPLVLMFQQEFAERMAADPGTDDYGRLSVTAGHYADVETVETVPPTAFSPQPRVDSAIVRLRPREPAYTVPDEAFFLDLLKAVFTQRRKTMRNAVRNTAHITELGDPDAVVDAADEELMGKRAGELPPATFAQLATLAYEVGAPGEY
jgi:16S rRNA (adenine1518-N6/adenine1519-N6)-dimethyltransferase